MRAMCLTDGKRIVISEQEEIGISAALNDDNDRVTVKGIPYKKTIIGYFDAATVEEMDAAANVSFISPWSDEYKNLEAGRQCVGRYSIQLMIIGIVQNDYPKDWGIRLQDKAFKESLRLQLRESGQKFCDGKIGECNCYDED